MRLDRIDREETIMVVVIQCPAMPELNDTSMSCRTLDVSEQGMKMVSKLDLPVDTLLGLRLELPDRLYRLQGQVRWSRNEGEIHVGLLLKTDSPDFAVWTKMFELDF